MTLFLDIPQNTTEWFDARLGRPTASVFSQVITPARAQKSTQSACLLKVLVAERITGVPQPRCPETEDMRRGQELEPKAAEVYARQTGAALLPGGFYMDARRRYGASPDRRIEGGGLLEIKCPRPANHIGFMLGEAFAEQHRAQVQGQLMVSGAPFVDLASFCPGVPMHIVRVERDEVFIGKMRDALEEFCDDLDAATDKIRQLQF